MANSGAFRKGVKRPKQGKRGPSKTTKDVREAIALIAQRNVEAFETWLGQVAADDPAKAADIFLHAIEYHIPKLARTENTGADGKPIQNEVTIRFIRPPVA